IGPAPGPTRSRPPLSMSSVAASRATITGCLRSLLRTKGPTRMREVAAEATASAVNGEGIETRWSARGKLEWPSWWARLACSIQAAADSASRALTPKRNGFIQASPLDALAAVVHNPRQRGRAGPGHFMIPPPLVQEQSAHAPHAEREK